MELTICLNDNLAKLSNWLSTYTVSSTSFSSSFSNTFCRQ